MSDEKKKGGGLSRRQLLKVSGLAGAAGVTGAAGYGVYRFAQAESEDVETEGGRDVGETTAAMYRSELEDTRGDAVGYSPHCVNCKGNCAWTVFAKDGRVVREEQVARYPQISPDLPDANPRGCNKGGLHSQAMYEEDRVLHPMKRAGERGEGRWRRISWDEALGEIAGKVVDYAGTGAFGDVMLYAGTGVLSPLRRVPALRLGSLLGAVRFNVAGAVGDMFPGATAAYGISIVGHSSEAWFEADYVLVWGMNPSVSRIPDAHYVWEGKYRGSRVVTLSPDYNATARQSSLWIPIEPGTDSFFAMSMIHVVLEEELYDEDFVREQTDLGLLVKAEDGRLLRESDMVPGGKDDVFFVWDEATGQPAKAPGSMGSPDATLDLGALRPALGGRFTVRTPYGEDIEVAPAMEVLRREAARFSPEETRRHTGIHPSIIRDEARRFAAAERAIVLMGYRIHKYEWGMLSCWGSALLLALTGHAGRRGGLDLDNEWHVGLPSTLSSPKPARFGSGHLGEWFDGGMESAFRDHFDDEELRSRAGVDKRELAQLARDAVKGQGFSYFGKPKVMLLFFDNKLSRNSAQKRSEAAVLDGVELLVDVNYRIDSTATMADIVLPAITNYEGHDLRFDPGYSRFANFMIPPPGLEVPGEAKSEWEICELLAAKIEEVAQARGIDTVPDPEFGVDRNLGGLRDELVRVEPGVEIHGGRELLEWALTEMPFARGWTLERAVREHGFITPTNGDAGQTSPLYPDRAFYSFEPQVYLKQPYATASGRQQFYIDHELYLRLGFRVPTAREPVRPGKFPFAYYTPHTRYSIHTTWRTNKYHLRLQRGEPHVCINPQTALRKGIRDHDLVRVFNDVGELFARAKLHPGTRPNAIWMEHAWENYQFDGHKGYNNVVAPMLSPLELAGGHGHLRFGPFWDGNQLTSAGSVDVEKVEGA